MIPFLQFPNYFKYIGLILYLSGFSLVFYYQPKILDATKGISILIQDLVLLGLVFICNAKEINEDEFIQHCRLKSLQWSVFIFIILRIFFKNLVWLTQDVDWTPNFQVNFLLQLYLLLFYYQIFFKDFLLNLFKKVKS